MGSNTDAQKGDISFIILFAIISKNLTGMVRLAALLRAFEEAWSGSVRSTSGWPAWSCRAGRGSRDAPRGRGCRGQGGTQPAEGCATNRGC